MHYKAVIFDIGGVLMYDVWEHVYLDQGVGIADLYGADHKKLEVLGRRLWEEFAYRTGDGLEHEYWERFVIESKELVSSVPSVETLIELSKKFIRPVDLAAATELLDALKKENVLLSICSNNNEFWFAEQMRVSGFDRYFLPEHTALSCRVGVSKGDPSNKMFTAALAQLGVQAHEAFFVDDRQGNVDRAMSLGIDAVLFPSEDPSGYELLKQKLNLTY